MGRCGSASVRDDDPRAEAPSRTAIGRCASCTFRAPRAGIRRVSRAPSASSGSTAARSSSRPRRSATRPTRSCSGCRRRSADRARLEAFRFRVLGACSAGAYDVVHFNFGQSLFPRPIVPGSPAVAGFPAPLQQLYRGWSALLGMRDLALLRRRGVALFVTFQGDDVRQADVCAGARRVGAGARDRADRGRAGNGSRRGARSHGASTAMPTASTILNPDLACVLPPRARFVPYAHVDPREWRPEARLPNARPLVVHAPDGARDQGHASPARGGGRAARGGDRLRPRACRGAHAGRGARRSTRAPTSWSISSCSAGTAAWRSRHGARRPGDLARPRRAISSTCREAFASEPPDHRRYARRASGDVLRTWLVERRAELPDARTARSRAFMERWHDPLRGCRTGGRGLPRRAGSPLS